MKKKFTKAQYEEALRWAEWVNTTGRTPEMPDYTVCCGWEYFKELEYTEAYTGALVFAYIISQIDGTNIRAAFPVQWPSQSSRKDVPALIQKILKNNFND